MATLGSTAATRENLSSDTRVNGISAGSVVAGTLTDIRLFAWRTWAGGSSMQIGVYQGGASDSDPTGATLIYDSGSITMTSVSAEAWYSLTTDFGKSISTAITGSSRIWIVFVSSETYVGLSNADSNELDLSSAVSGDSVNGNAYLGQNPASALATPFPTYTQTGTAETMMIQLIYTAGGGGGDPGPYVPRTVRPSVRSQANTSSAAAVSLTLPTHLKNDIILVAIESANESITTSSFTSNGYTEITGSTGPADGIGTAAAANATKLTLFFKRAANSTEPAIHCLDSGDHQTIGVVVIANANNTLTTPWEVSENTRQTTNTTSVSFNNITTTNANTLIVHVIGADTDTTTSQLGAPTNANLTSITEHTDVFTNTQDGGGVGIITGGKATAGAIGNTTLTLATTEIFTTWTAAILPFVYGPVFSQTVIIL